MSIPIRNVVRMASASLAFRFTGKRRPLNVMLSLTDRCTGRCAYCKIPDRKSPEMTTGQILRLLEEAARMGCQRVGLWGGEPLVRDDLGEIIGRAKQLGLFVTVDTNGHLLPERDEALRRVDHLNISLNGDREAHDSACGKGSFDKTMAAIKHAKGRYRFWTITVLHKENLRSIDWILETAAQFGFWTTFQPLHHNDHLGANNDFSPSDSKLRDAARHLLIRKRQGAPIANSVKYLRHLIRWPDYGMIRTKESFNGRKCLAGALYCNVDADGSMYPCSLVIDEVPAPNAVTLGFASAFADLKKNQCESCLAACFTDYNLLYHLDLMTGLNWARALLR